MNKVYVRKLISGIRKQIDLGMKEFREENELPEAVDSRWIDAELLCLHLERDLDEVDHEIDPRIK